MAIGLHFAVYLLDVLTGVGAFEIVTGISCDEERCNLSAVVSGRDDDVIVG